MTAPVLRTERMTLRRPEPQDLEPFVAFCASERSRWIGGPAPREDAWEGFALNLGHWEMLGFGYFHAELTKTGTPVGRVGLRQQEGKPEPEVAYSIYTDALEGLGLATEAACACRDWAFGDLNLPSLVSYIDPKNIRSQSVALRMGAHVDADAPRWPSHATLEVWRHPKPGAVS